MKDNNKETSQNLNQGGKSKKPQRQNKFVKGTRNNDVSWYKKNKSLFDQACKVSTLRVYGDYPWLDLHYTETIEWDTTTFVPEHVICVRVDASLGEVQDQNSPINRAALQTYNIIRGQFTNTVSFQANDLACYFGSVGTILTAISQARKFLELVKYASINNAYSARLIIDGFTASNGFWQDMKDNYGDYIFKLQSICDRLQALAIPDQMTYFDKCLWMTRYLYTESYSDKTASTIYSCNLNTGLQWSSTVPTTDPEVLASGLIPVSFDVGDFSEFLDNIDTCISALVDDDNVRNISVWIAKYIPHFVYVKDLVEVEHIVPTRSDIFASQLRNAVSCNSYSLLRSNGDYIYHQDVNNQCLIETVISANTAELLINTFEFYLPDPTLNTFDIPTEDDVMEYTRLTPYFSFYGSGNQRKFIYHGDVFYISGITVINKSSLNDDITVKPLNQYFSDGGLTSEDVYESWKQLAVYVNSPILPMTYLLHAPLDQESQSYLINSWYPVLYEGHNKPIDRMSLQNLHYAAILSQFDAAYLITSKK